MLEMQASPKPFRPLALSTDILNEQVFQCCSRLGDEATEFDYQVLEASSAPTVQEQPERLKSNSKWKEQVNQYGSFLISCQRETLLPPGMLDKILKDVEEKSKRKLLKFLAQNIIRHYCESKNDVVMRHFRNVLYQSHLVSINMNAGDSGMKTLEIRAMINSKLNSIALNRMTK